MPVGTATSAEPGGQDVLDRRLRAKLRRALQAPKSAVAIIVERQRVRHAATREDDALLECVDAAQRF